LGIAADAMIACENDLMIVALYINDIDLAVESQATKEEADIQVDNFRN
jgi:hypothetical protein